MDVVLGPPSDGRFGAVPLRGLVGCSGRFCASSRLHVHGLALVVLLPSSCRCCCLAVLAPAATPSLTMRFPVLAECLFRKILWVSWLRVSVFLGWCGLLSLSTSACCCWCWFASFRCIPCLLLLCCLIWVRLLLFVFFLVFPLSLFAVSMVSLVFLCAFLCQPLSASVCLCSCFTSPPFDRCDASLHFLACFFSSLLSLAVVLPRCTQEFFHVLVFRSARADLLLPLFDVSHCVLLQLSASTDSVPLRICSSDLIFATTSLYSDLILSLFLGSVCLALTSQFLGDSVERLLYCHAVLLCDPLSRVFACFCCSWLNSIFGTAFASSS